MQNLLDLYHHWTRDGLRRIIFYGTILALACVAVSAALGWIILFVVGAVAGTVAMCASIIDLREKRDDFKKMIEEMRMDSLKAAVLEDDIEITPKTLEKFDPFSDNEKAYIKRRKRAFKFGIVLRVFMVLIMVVLFWNMIVN
ncbi:MAG: hypothetical protein FWE38_04290 [Firmicutes bacterium]|nr:hypothetical protein [Bacillota bacterium]